MDYKLIFHRGLGNAAVLYVGEEEKKIPPSLAAVLYIVHEQKQILKDFWVSLEEIKERFAKLLHIIELRTVQTYVARLKRLLDNLVEYCSYKGCRIRERMSVVL